MAERPPAADRPATRALAPEPLRVLFVCTGNISRSAYAEARTRQLFDDPRLEVASAGVPGLEREPMDPAMAAELVARGGDPSAHRSRRLTAEVVDWADLLVCATTRHRELVIDDWPAAATRTVTFGQLRQVVQELEDDQSVLERIRRRPPRAQRRDDVADPYGRGPEVARVCADLLDDHLRAVVPALVERGTR